ncbi:MAG: 50S ribosomal protein L32 [Firmicutes bacterium]|jgi:large subunit ribosomal protein L32|nr:50S ribosomal protein L32 [Bacillota bacterium]NLO65402.1 50S ribosomal protein L32 [Bacillota bacterium]
MAVPKRKHSKARTNSRRANWRRIEARQVSVCPSCGESKLPHRACLACGTYKGRQVVQVEAE